jgi:osmotically-inducible protein OsmY
MPDKPLTYDEITRRTVPEPDSSFRPTREQEEAAYRGFRATTPDEDRLAAKVRTALASHDLADVSLEITGVRVALRGKVRDVALIDRLGAAVAAVDGVEGVDNFLVVGA